MNGGALILAGGAAVALYLWYRSQQAQAAALAAAQAAPGPGFIGKAENTVSRAASAFPAVVRSMASVATDAATLDFLQHGTPLNQQNCAQLLQQYKNATNYGTAQSVMYRANPMSNPYYQAAKAKGCV